MEFMEIWEIERMMVRAADRIAELNSAMVYRDLAKYEVQRLVEAKASFARCQAELAARSKEAE